MATHPSPLVQFVSLKGIFTNALLLIVSVLITFAAVEAFLRFGLSPERLVPNAPETPALNERRNALRFYARQLTRSGSSGHDRWLGWDAGDPSTRVRGRKVIEPPTQNQRRVIALGDSFTWGNEVAAEENFAYLLDQADNGLEVLNMGVPGYGIDQMVLKYERHGAVLAPDLLVLGIYVSDYERSTVAFTAGPKPLFQPLGDQLLLTNSPVPAPAVAMAQIEASLQGQLFLDAFVRNRLPQARQSADEFFDAADALVAGLLRRLRDGLDEDQRLLILHIPRGESFMDPDPFHQEMSTRLKAIYRKLGLAVVDLGEAFSAAAPSEEIPERFYRVRESGSVGHLNPAGHVAAAEALSTAILQ
jgi:hypothetical protein